MVYVNFGLNYFLQFFYLMVQASKSKLENQTVTRQKSKPININTNAKHAIKGTLIIAQIKKKIHFAIESQF